MINWDYNLPKNWKPKTDEEWEWFLTRTVNYGLGETKIDPNMLKKYIDKIKIDPFKREFLEFILKK